MAASAWPASRDAGRAQAEPFQPWQHLGDEIRNFLQVIDERDGASGEACGTHARHFAGDFIRRADERVDAGIRSGVAQAVCAMETVPQRARDLAATIADGRSAVLD